METVEMQYKKDPAVPRREVETFRHIGLAEVTFAGRKQIAEHLQDSSNKSYLRLPSGQIVRASQKEKGKRK
jgi:hypothetical protein